MKIKPTERTGGGIVELGRKTQRSTLFGEKITPALPVIQLKKILVPVDFSDRMKKALLYAVPFARQFDAELTLLHVVEPPYAAAAEMGAISDMQSMDDAKNELLKLRDQVAVKVRCNAILRNGSAQYEIVALAKELGSDLIILSTHGRTGLERMFMGSTAEKVVRLAKCPVLIVRENEHEFITDCELNSQDVKRGWLASI